MQLLSRHKPMTQRETPKNDKQVTPTLLRKSRDIDQNEDCPLSVRLRSRNDRRSKETSRQCSPESHSEKQVYKKLKEKDIAKVL
jgi:hypothetical protein